MKHCIIIISILALVLTGCNELDLNPLSEGSSENWYTNEEELRMAGAYLYDLSFWDTDLTQITTTFGNYSSEWTDKFSDDWTARNTVSAITQGTINSQTDFVVLTWSNSYKCIAAANRLIENIDRASGSVAESELKRFEAVAKFARAAQYARLIFLFGDVPF